MKSYHHLVAPRHGSITQPFQNLGHGSSEWGDSRSARDGPVNATRLAQKSALFSPVDVAERDGMDALVDLIVALAGVNHHQLVERQIG